MFVVDIQVYRNAKLILLDGDSLDAHGIRDPLQVGAPLVDEAEAGEAAGEVARPFAHNHLTAVCHGTEPRGDVERRSTERARPVVSRNRLAGGRDGAHHGSMRRAGRGSRHGVSRSGTGGSLHERPAGARCCERTRKIVEPLVIHVQPLIARDPGMIEMSKSGAVSIMTRLHPSTSMPG